MYERFSDSARLVMQRANEEAQLLNHEYIGTEHVLLAIVEDENCVAANVLRHLEIDVRSVPREIEKLVKNGPDVLPKRRRPETPSAKKVIEYSMEEARKMEHRYVGTEHIVLGLLREQHGIAAHVLTQLGVSLDAARQQILQTVGRAGSTLEGMALAPQAGGGRLVLAGLFALLAVLAALSYWLLYH
jgi:ATP-dependent Clp protease ATP-binding subunit ClpC